MLLLGCVCFASTVDPTGSSDEAEHLLSALPKNPFAPLPKDSQLRKNVDFWINIYTQYDTHQGLVHDAKYIDHIYEVVDLGDTSGRISSRMEKAAKHKWRDILLSVHHKEKTPEKMNTDEKRVYDLFADVNEPNKFLAAAHRKRLRFQLGQKDRFKEGLFHSGRYLPAMEEIFRSHDLPVELTRLPFVESSFNVRARSKVGASGIWQFMRSTGKLFLKVNDTVDERNDPVLATEAAAKLLSLNFNSLSNWPLAVTAYNHGRKGMMRAVRKVGSDELEDVVSGYRARTFGFASSNFFTELLASIEVERNVEKYFGKMERDKPRDFVEVPLPDPIRFRDLVQYLKLDPADFRDLNPGLSENVYEGRRMIPAGYRLRISRDGGIDKDAQVRVFLTGYEQIPALYKKKHVKR